MSPSPRLRVGMVGAGMISRHHMIAWSKLGHKAEIVVVCDPDVERAQGRAREFGINAVCQTADELFASHDLDAIDIASPRHTHADWVRRAAAHGLGILCQKPLAPTLAEAEALLRAIGSLTRLMVHENWRFHSVYKTLKAWIQGGDLGAIRMVRGAYLSSAYLPDATGEAPAFARQPSIRREPRLFIAEAFIHHIDVARYLCGPLRLIGARAHRTLTQLPGETLASLMLETQSAAPVMLFGSMAAPGYPVRGSDEFDIIGDRASARVRGAELELLGDPSRQMTYDPDQSYQGCFDGAIQHFVDSLITGNPFESDAFDNLETLRLVEHAYWASGMQTGIAASTT